MIPNSLCYNEAQMGNVKQQGFTIIETILFLAVGGALLAALLAGVNTNINQERYKDSVNSFTSTLQEQYSLATNVTSLRSNNWTCGTTLKGESGANTYRGTTNCTIIGRLVKLTGSGTLAYSNIIAYNINETTLKTATSDIAGMTESMSLTTMDAVSSTTTEDHSETTLEWDSSLTVLDGRGAKAGRGDSFTLAVVRSPVTGRIMTFVANEATTDWKNKIITAESLKRSLVACVEPSQFIATPRSAIVITAGSATPNGVTKAAGVAGC